jgi:hypothetical protein
MKFCRFEGMIALLKKRNTIIRSGGRKSVLPGGENKRFYISYCACLDRELTAGPRRASPAGRLSC